MAQVNATSRLYAYISAVWTLLDDIKPLTAEWGIPGNSPTDLLATTGQMTLILNNSTGQYSPNGPSALSGWKKGIPLKLVCTYDNEDYVRFRGVISDIQVGPDNSDKKAYVTVLDWMDYAARHPIQNYGIETNITSDEVMTALIADMPIQPQATDFEAGVEIFPTAFDTVTSKTKSYSEFSKIAYSELAHIYLRKDRINGETLISESANTRHGWREPDEVPLSVSVSGFLLKEDGDFLLKEDGDQLVLNEIAAPIDLDENIITSFEAPYGAHVINRAVIYANPRKLDSSPQILFQLDEPIAIGSGRTKRIRGTYANPDGGLPINAQDMIDPVITTDYLMNTKADGTGTNISSDLVIVTSYGTEGFVHTVTNNNAKKGYITLFNCRGTGIYIYNPIEHSSTDQGSIDEYETETETINQKYKNDLDSGAVFTASVVDEFKQPRTVLNSITFCANHSDGCMTVFLNTDVGNLRYISIPEAGIDGNYYIQGVEMNINDGIIMVKWYVKFALSLPTGLSPLAVEFPADGTSIVDFGPLPRISNVTQRSESVWIYLDSDAAIYVGYNQEHIMGIFSDDAGFGVGVSNGRKLRLYQKGETQPGIWETPSNSLPLSAWTHILITRDATLAATAPIMYINGVSQTVTETNAQSGALADESDSSMQIGNINTVTIANERPFDGQIFDARVYNGILTSTDATTLYNAGVPDETLLTSQDTGLMFQAFTTRTGDLASYIGTTLDDTMTLRDAVYGAVGVPNGAPVGRAAP